MATACYKWLLGPAEAGYLYVKDELIENFEPPFVVGQALKRKFLKLWISGHLKLKAF